MKRAMAPARLIPSAGIIAVVVSAVTIALGAAFAVLNLLNVRTVQASDVGESALLLAITTITTLLGALIVRRTNNPIGWIFLFTALAAAVSSMGEAYIYAAFRPHPRDLPALGFVAWLTNAVTALGVAPVPALLLLFPTGRLRSSRWRWALGLWLLGIAAVVAWGVLHSGHYGAPPGEGLPSIDVDYSGPALPEPFADVLAYIAIVALVGSGILGVLSLVLRYRRAEGDVRQQMRWLTFVASMVAVDLALFLVFGVAGFTDVHFVEDVLWLALVLLIIVGVPAAVAIAVLKYRLYDVDIVIHKTVVYSTLAIFITVVYVGLVVGVGTLVGAGDEPNVALQIAATAVVAVAFQPVRERAQRLADGVVYGRRATPYEVLTAFSERVGETYSIEDVLPRMVQVLASATGATSAKVMLRVGDGLRDVARWPERDERPGTEHAVAVEHLGEELGVLAVTMPANDPMDPSKERLMRDLASQAGLVLRNVRLIEELRASRKRIVSAQDERARKVERDLHDGAQQQLVALTVKLRLLQQLAERDPTRVPTLVDQLQNDAQHALDDLRDLARGIYPPLLADKGLPDAISSQVRRSALPVTVETDSIGRYPRDVESAVYFCTLEALNNVAKYADATHAVVRLAQSNGQLTFSVMDDGRGFDPRSTAVGTGIQGMTDRLEAIGGELDVASEPGGGTTVLGRVPVGESL